MILSAGKNEIFNFAIPVGVGLLDSSINLTKLILENNPNLLVFIGSAGSYGNYQIFDIVKSNIASNIELSFLQSNSYTPINNVIKSINATNEYKRDVNIINSSNYITINFEIAKKFLIFNIELENMEFYSIVKVASYFEIPVFGIFIVTNFCNENAHRDFISNHKQAMKLLSSYVKNEFNIK